MTSCSSPREKRGGRSRLTSSDFLPRRPRVVDHACRQERCEHRERERQQGGQQGGDEPEGGGGGQEGGQPRAGHHGYRGTGTCFSSCPTQSSAVIPSICASGVREMRWRRVARADAWTSSGRT